MAKTALKGNPVNTNQNLPEVGSSAPAFELTLGNLTSVSLADYAGKNVILNIFPSVDTSVCAASVRKFNELAAGMENTHVLCISRDLPFALNRFCGAEGIKDVTTLSEMKNTDFSTVYGVRIIDGPMEGLMARAIIIVNTKGEVIYTQLVDEITTEPDYDKALAALK
jgi:thiol peroxidase